MAQVTFERIETDTQIADVSAMAYEIWPKHFVPDIVSAAHISHMLDSFQSPTAIAKQIRNDGYEYSFVCCAGERVGYIALVPHPECSSLYISKFYLKEQFRGKGISHYMNRFAETRARELHFGRLFLNCNRTNSAVLAYKALGFTVDKEEELDIGEGFICVDYVLHRMF